MVTCPVCDGDIDVDEEEVDEGDTLSCDECGASLKVLGKDPLELESADAADDDEDEDDIDDEDEDDEDVKKMKRKRRMMIGNRDRRPASAYRALFPRIGAVLLALHLGGYRIFPVRQER